MVEDLTSLGDSTLLEKIKFKYYEDPTLLGEDYVKGYLVEVIYNYC